MAIDFTDHDRDPVAVAIEQVQRMTDEELNRHVDFIREEMKDRARRRNRLAKAQLKVGDKVRIAGNTKPQYLSGLTGEVVEMRQTRVVMLLDRGPTKKFRSGRVVITPGILEKIG